MGLSDWQPIETAPKDETPILAYCPDDTPSVYVIRWLPPTTEFAGAWIEAGGEQWERFEPTHWMPLPEPPR